MRTSKRLRVRATTGVSPSAYGGNVYIQVTAVDAPRALASERLLSAATHRAAAMVEERILEQSTCAVCVDENDGRIHLEFAESAGQAEQDAARSVLDAVAGAINRSQGAK
jgi:hypothetical protein